MQHNICWTFLNLFVVRSCGSGSNTIMLQWPVAGSFCNQWDLLRTTWIQFRTNGFELRYSAKHCRVSWHSVFQLISFVIVNTALAMYVCVVFGVAITICTVWIHLQFPHHATSNHVLHITITKYPDPAPLGVIRQGWCAFMVQCQRQAYKCHQQRTLQHCLNHIQLVSTIANVAGVHACQEFCLRLGTICWKYFFHWLRCTLKLLHPPQQISYNHH